MSNDKMTEIKRQKIFFRRITIILAIVVLAVSVLFAVLGIKYKNQKTEINKMQASVSQAQNDLQNKESMANSNSEAVESYKNAMNEQSSAFDEEKNKLNEKISELNKQIALKKQQQKQDNSGHTQGVEQPQTGGAKTIYLTFDDGPSSNTPEILKILSDNGVRATFFVKDGGKYNGYMKDIVNQGHVIALHTYTHDYEKVYASDEAYFDDLQKISDLVNNETGVRSNIIRFPGGSSNTVSRKYSSGIMSRLTKEVENRGYHYFDWNVVSGDAASKPITAADILSNCQKLPKSNTVIVLMHDTHSKKSTVEALPQVIAYYKSIGCSFGVIDSNTYEVHQRVNN